MLFPQMLFRRCQKTKDLLTAEEREGGGGGCLHKVREGGGQGEGGGLGWKEYEKIINATPY